MDLHRLRWASRRGMLELDLVLLPFVENVYAGLPSEDQARFDALLECEDQDLFNWFLRKGVPEDAEHRETVELVLRHTGLQPEDGSQ